MPRSTASSTLHPHRLDPVGFTALGQRWHEAFTISKEERDALKTLVASFTKAYVFRIEIPTETEARVWRQIRVLEDMTFHKFHKVLQIAFGWEDTQLYQFRVQAPGADEGGKPKGLLSMQEAGWTKCLRGKLGVEDEDGRAVYVSSGARLTRVFGDKGSATTGNALDVVYQYDTLHNWMHAIQFLGIEKNEVPLDMLAHGVKEGQRAYCIDGEGQAPPEDGLTPQEWECRKWDYVRRGLDIWDWDIVRINRRLDHMWLEMTAADVRRMAREVEGDHVWKQAVERRKMESRERMEEYGVNLVVA